MAVNSVKPKEALQELRHQEQIVNALVDSQVILQLMVKHNIVTREEVAEMRSTVRSSSKYKPILDSIETQKKAYEYAVQHPDEYLKAMFNAKLNS